MPSSLDIKAFLDEWGQFMIGQGAVPARSYEEQTYHVRQHAGEISELQEAKLVDAMERITSMTEDEFIYYMNHIYAPVHPNWIADMVLMDHCYFMLKLLELISQRKQTNGLFDVGSGPGPYSVFLGSYGLVKSPIVCIDPVMRLLLDGKELAESQGANVEFIEGRITQECLPVKSGIFDLVLGIDVLHWTVYWKNGLRQMVRALRPGGSLFIVYSALIRRVQLQNDQVERVLLKSGMKDIKAQPFMSPVSGNPRIIVTATKR